MALQTVLRLAGLGHLASASEEDMVAVARGGGNIPGTLCPCLAQLSIIWPRGSRPLSMGMTDVKQMEAKPCEGGKPFIKGFSSIVGNVKNVS